MKASKKGLVEAMRHSCTEVLPVLRQVLILCTDDFSDIGEGLLRDQQGQGADARVTVDFVGYGRKQLLLRHARLERA